MKNLENKITEIPTGKDEEGPVDYAKLINICLDHAPEAGFDRRELRNRARIGNVVEASNGTFEFEDADAKNLKRIVNRDMRWGSRHADILQFCDDVEAL